MHRLSYALALGLIAVGGVFLHLAWWSTAMLVGAALFSLGYLWGDNDVLQARHGAMIVAAGALCVCTAAVLAWRLGVGVGDFQEIGSQLKGRRSGRLLYQLPGFGVGLITYGLIVWSRAWAHDRETNL